MLAAKLSETELRTLFEAADTDKNGTISTSEFATIVARTQIQLSSAEVTRLVRALDTDGSGELDFEEFRRGFAESTLLRAIVSDYSSPAAFDVPEDYKWTEPTHTNYAGEPFAFAGQLLDARQKRDYDYHAHFAELRQHWQDSLVQSISARSPPVDAPFLIYTAGPPGAGKSYVLSWMSEKGYLPLENVVQIDPDRIKAAMPEWPHYLKQVGEKAAALCHRESGLIAELVQHVAMEERQNIWVDGTLKDANYFTTLFKQFAVDYPHYRICLIKISAPEEVLRQRIEARAKKTGRSVPPEVIKEGLEGVDRSLQILTPLVHFVAHVSNGDDSEPVLEMCQMIDTSGNWDNLRSLANMKL
ncbi:zeta toxin-domain-containing protein [Hyaloraphidium curvatum]|nr:zeta toxin-domain-containing protein [Hyaloraphidium curvatum]